MSIEPIIRDAIIYSNLLVLISMGLTLTYLTTKVPNFAHGSFVTTGTYTTLTLTKIHALNPYSAIIVAPFIGGCVAFLQYKLVLKPLMRRGANIVALMIATIAFDIIMLAVLNIYADYLTRVHKITSRLFSLKGYDFVIFDTPAILIVSTVLTLTLVLGLYFLLNKTKFGVAMRASIENPSLASTLGINVDLMYSVSWFLAGASAGIAGSLLPLWFLGNPDIGPSMLPSMFAASIAGGLSSIYGAIIGGYLIGTIEVYGTSVLASIVGTWIIPYRPILPLIVIAVTLLLAPQGIMGIEWQKIIKKIRREYVRST